MVCPKRARDVSLPEAYKATRNSLARTAVQRIPIVPYSPMSVIRQMEPLASYHALLPIGAQIRDIRCA